MIRISIALLVLVAAVALVVSVPVSAAPKVTGTVGPGFTISLKAKSLKAGKSYRFEITDRSSIHNFHLRGPGVNKEITGVSFLGRKSVTLKLKRGLYRFVCDPHAGQMKGSFRVR
jgi:plastocyanin